MFKKMMMTLLSAVLLSSAANAQSADDFNFVRVVNIQENYGTSHVEVPEARCHNVSVPVYRNVGPSSGDILAGAIIGGVIGREVTNKDRGAVAGVVIGTIIASESNRNVIAGYAYEQQCEVIIVRERRQVVIDYTVTYSNQRERGVVNTRNYYAIGSVISMRELLSR